MIDALEISVPASIRPRSEIWDKFSEIRLKKGAYIVMRDCRSSLGFVDFEGHRHIIKKEHAHLKVKFVAARQLTADDTIRRILRLFPLDEAGVRQLKLVRIDFAANVSPSVEWFRRHFRVMHKQESAEYIFVQKTTREVTTLVFGKRPDRYTIYDKIKEVIDGTGRPPLQSGVRPDDKPRPVTRVERQCSGAAVPSLMRSIGGFFNNVERFDPFEHVELMAGEELPNTAGWKARDWLMCLGAKGAVESLGLDVARKESERRSTRNGVLDKYLKMLVSTQRPSLTRAQLSAAYRKTMLYQLNQPEEGVYPQGGISAEV